MTSGVLPEPVRGLATTTIVPARDGERCTLCGQPATWAVLWRSELSRREQRRTPVCGCSRDKERQAAHYCPP
jgi:hypothetical protein